MNHARPILLTSVAVAAALAYVCGACSSSSRLCNVGADCASGACNADGTCVPVSYADGGGADGSAASDGSAGSKDGSSAVDGSYDFDAGSACKPNHDGTITRDEVPLGPGLKANFAVSGAAGDAGVETIVTAGTKNPDGTYTWDFTAKLASDQTKPVETLAPTGAWWAPDFAKATHAAKLLQSNDLLGVFLADTGSLSLLGEASPVKTAGSYTELTYDTPIAILKFPFMLSSTWTTTSNAGGTYQGGTIASAYYTETYETTVDKAGVVKTPYASFPALRIGTLLTQDVNFLTYHNITMTRTYAWVSECYGTVAKATSTSATGTNLVPPTAPAVDFTNAAELLRLSQ